MHKTRLRACTPPGIVGNGRSATVLTDVQMISHMLLLYIVKQGLHRLLHSFCKPDSDD